MRDRKERSIEAMVDYGVEVADSQDVLIELVEREKSDLLLAAIKSLNSKHQKIVNLVYFQGLQKQEAARQLGITNGAVTQQLATIHKKLKEFLDKT